MHYLAGNILDRKIKSENIAFTYRGLLLRGQSSNFFSNLAFIELWKRRYGVSSGARNER